MSMLFVAASTQTVAMGSGSTALANAAGATLMAWVNPVSLPTPAGNSVFGLSNGISAGSSRAKIGVMGSGALRGNGRCLDEDSNQDFSGGPAGVVTLGTWQHIAATFDYPNKLIRLYYNGVLNVTSGVVTWGASSTSNTASQSMNIGSQHGGGSEYWDGGIDDARCYNRLLSASELLIIASARGRDKIVYGLQHRYVLIEGAPGNIASSTPVIVDVGATQKNGTPANSTTWSTSLLKFRKPTIG